ncbi:hypothetical protein GCM10011409_31870 [Lentibacillus populi]|uniref:Acyltransferase 3 domain-containing protein n=1 Tax=Lentibacillus populi TaxID=1827502 RepID=A0A9W5TZZ5_9BACI|nr:acyltransferase [Lentibacillus populi]GGB51904.1 hypothetical protein GCM10011409_31870 [Lentibacillus populi]
MERNDTLDFIKFFAIFFVVAIHSGTLKGVELGAVQGDDVDFAIDTFARFAVPFFFVTSGYLFMQKMKDIQEKNKRSASKKQLTYLKKYLMKLVKLYFAWVIFYFMFALVIDVIETEKTREAMIPMLTDFIASFKLESILYYGLDWPQYHLWFLLALIWAILILFVFSKARLLKVLLIVSLGLNIYGLFGQSYSFLYEAPYKTRDALFFALFYVTLGAIMARYYPTVKSIADKIPTKEYVLGVACLSVLQVVEGFITLQIYDGKSENYYITTIPLLIVLFLFVIKHSRIGKNSLFSKIGVNAVGIYVSHVFIMESIRIFMQRLGLTAFEDTVLWKLVFTPMVFIMAYFFYSGLQNGKKIVQSAGKEKTSTTIRNRELEYQQRGG